MRQPATLAISIAAALQLPCNCLAIGKLLSSSRNQSPWLLAGAAHTLLANVRQTASGTNLVHVLCTLKSAATLSAPINLLLPTQPMQQAAISGQPASPCASAHARHSNTNTCQAANSPGFLAPCSAWYLPRRLADSTSPVRYRIRMSEI